MRRRFADVVGWEVVNRPVRATSASRHEDVRQCWLAFSSSERVQDRIIALSRPLVAGSGLAYSVVATRCQILARLHRVCTTLASSRLERRVVECWRMGVEME